MKNRAESSWETALFLMNSGTVLAYFPSVLTIASVTFSMRWLFT